MKEILRSFSTSTEFLLILFICFGLSIAASTIWIINHASHAPVARPVRPTQTNNKDVIYLTNNDAVFSSVFESLTLGLALWIGKIRGWSLKNFGMQISWKWTSLGVLLFLTNYLQNTVLHLLMTGRWHDPPATHGAPSFLRVNHLTIPFIILLATVNPLFEEAIESGYFFHTLRRYGMWLTVFVAALFRGFLHTTMGWNGFITMFCMGLLFGFVYWRWRQLWPLMVAHSLQMYLALLPSAFGR